MLKRKRITELFIIIYFITVLWYTVFNRSLRLSTAQFDLFWSYKVWLAGDMGIGKEILSNMAMFVPFGFLITSFFSKRRFVFVILGAILFSLSIEILQFYLMRGLFELDDVVSNTIGACVGILLFLAVDRAINEKYRAITMKFLATFFIISCVVVIIRSKGMVQTDNTLQEYCFQIDWSDYVDGEIHISGFAFRYEYPASDYTLFLRSDDGKRIVLEKESVTRPDVNEYFSCDYDYSTSGFTARGEVEGGEYEVLIKWPWSIALSTGVYVGSSIHYVPEEEFVAPAIDEIFVEEGVLRVYRPDYHCWVYQYDGSLYWIVDQEFNFEDDDSTYIQYQMWTTQTEKLPQHRLENNWLWDNIGGNFEEFEIQGDWGEYRIMKREIPTAYSVTSIVTGYHKDGEWIWKEYFRPYYEFE